MSRYACDLCVLLVNDTYGELTSRLYEGLLRHGRSTIPALQHVTRLSLRQIKHGLSVLIQQHLIFWHRASEHELGTYEANVSAAYNLLRTGKYVKITENRVGEFASTVISHLLLLGHARVGDLMQAYGIAYTKDTTDHVATKLGLTTKTTSKEKDASTKASGNDAVTREKINETLCELLRVGLVVPVNDSNFRSDADNRIEAEQCVGELAEYKIKGKTKKEVRAIWEAEVRAKIHQWKFGSNEERSEIEAFKLGMKRPLEDPEESPSEKRQRLHLAMSKQIISSAGGREAKLTFNNLLKNELVVRVNHGKFAVMIRNDHLVHLAEQAIGNVTSRIYEKALHKMEARLLACKEDAEEDEDDDEVELSYLPSVTTSELATTFNEGSELAQALGKVNPEMAEDMSDHPKKRRRKSSGIQDEVTPEGNASADEDDGSGSSGEESDNISVIEINSDQDMAEDEYAANGEHVFAPTLHHQAIRQHLLLLTQHPDCFLYHIRATPTEPERWAVQFNILRRTAALKTIFHTIDTRLGTLSTRLARICQQHGRMDDKSLQSKSLLTQKEMRARLLEMQNAGLLDLQEVPRDNSRLASRTTFLYYMDEGKAKAKITDECYKTMTRCLQRLAVEREKVVGVLEKVERSDVKGREEEFLGAKEKEALGRWKAQEEMIWGEIGRVDEVVVILRDF